MNLLVVLLSLLMVAPRLCTEAFDAPTGTQRFTWTDSKELCGGYGKVPNPPVTRGAPIGDPRWFATIAVKDKNNVTHQSFTYKATEAEARAFVIAGCPLG